VQVVVLHQKQPPATAPKRQDVGAKVVLKEDVDADERAMCLV
jgi:hypothetical protein